MPLACLIILIIVCCLFSNSIYCTLLQDDEEEEDSGPVHEINFDTFQNNDVTLNGYDIDGNIYISNLA